jgi:hypothetical protein
MALLNLYAIRTAWEGPLKGFKAPTFTPEDFRSRSFSDSESLHWQTFHDVCETNLPKLAVIGCFVEIWRREGWWCASFGHHIAYDRDTTVPGCYGQSSKQYNLHVRWATTSEDDPTHREAYTGCSILAHAFRHILQHELEWRSKTSFDLEWLSQPYTASLIYQHKYSAMDAYKFDMFETWLKELRRSLFEAS